jgi:hypothetical protein
MTGSDEKARTGVLDSDIVKLERQILNLQKYEEDFVALGLEDSRKMLAAQLADLESQLKTKKREKSLLLIDRLKREGFSGLAAVVGKEVGLSIDLLGSGET